MYAPQGRGRPREWGPWLLYWLWVESEVILQADTGKREVARILAKRYGVTPKATRALLRAALKSPFTKFGQAVIKRVGRRRFLAALNSMRVPTLRDLHDSRGAFLEALHGFSPLAFDERLESYRYIDQRLNRLLK